MFVCLLGILGMCGWLLFYQSKQSNHANANIYGLSVACMMFVCLVTQTHDQLGTCYKMIGMMHERVNKFNFFNFYPTFGLLIHRLYNITCG